MDNRDKIQGMLDSGEARLDPESSQIQTRNGAGAWGPVTGDHDLFRIEVPILPDLPADQIPAHLARVKAEVMAEVMAELRLPPFGARHGAHIVWVPTTDSARVIDAEIMGAHTVGRGDALLRVSAGRPAHITYSSGTR